MSSNQKNIQIPQDLFFDLIRYFCLEDMSDERFKAISKALEEKIDKIQRHNEYTTSKTALNASEREAARKKYLDMVGIHKDFRW